MNSKSTILLKQQQLFHSGNNILINKSQSKNYNFVLNPKEFTFQEMKNENHLKLIQDLAENKRERERQISQMSSIKWLNINLH